MVDHLLWLEKNNFGYWNFEELLKINDIVNTYVNSLDSYILNYPESDMDSISYLYFIANYYKISNEKEKWLDYAYTLLKELKRDLKEEKFRFSLGLFGGLTEVGFVLLELIRETNTFKKFYESIHSLICTTTIYYIQYCFKNIDNLSVKHYDLITGLSGIGYYYIEYLDSFNKSSIEAKKIINQIANYFSFLINDDKLWIVKNQNLSSPQDKLLFPNGCVNFGLAHGLMGPLVFLSKAYNRGYLDTINTNIIYKLIFFYEKYSIKNKNGVVFWPTQLSYFDYINYNLSLNKNRISWCYGNIGLSRALYMCGRFLNDKNIQLRYMNNLINIANMDIADFYLSSPIICHGYSGIINIFSEFEDEISYNFKKINKICLHKIFEFYNKDEKFCFDCKVIKDDPRTYNNSFLDGSTGIILTLISLFTDTNISSHLMIK